LPWKKNITLDLANEIAEIDVADVFFYTNVGHISSLVYVIFILRRKVDKATCI
jgi:hypothetical protein